MSMEWILLGTGAADWQKPRENGEYRGYTSALLDSHILLDCTEHSLRKMQELGIEWAQVTDLFFTHSHDDHCDVEAVQAIAEARQKVHGSPLRIYGEGSWIQTLFAPEESCWQVSRLSAYEEVSCGDYRLLPLAANHRTERETEIALSYLVRRGGHAVLYALDGAWMLNKTWQVLRKTTIDAWIVDCTIGDGHEGDYRIFEHNSLPMVRAMANTLMAKTPYGPPVLKQGAPIILNHLAKTLHPCQEELEQRLQPPFVVARDGMRFRIG